MFSVKSHSQDWGNGDDILSMTDQGQYGAFLIYLPSEVLGIRNQSSNCANYCSSNQFILQTLSENSFKAKR